MKIRNWKLLLLGLVGTCLLASLGFWQLSRAEQKKTLLKSFAERTERAPFSLSELNPTNDLRFYRVTLSGTFDNQHTFLLDNKISQGVVGYEVYTPFFAKGSSDAFLIDRGFVPMGINRQTLPTIPAINGKVTIVGLINKPPAYVSFGKMADTVNWPLRVEYIQLNEMSQLLNHTTFFPYLVMLSPNDPAAYKTAWEIVAIGPERHQGYAVQWFALALTLLILSVLLNREPKKRTFLVQK